MDKPQRDAYLGFLLNRLRLLRSEPELANDLKTIWEQIGRRPETYTGEEMSHEFLSLLAFHLKVLEDRRDR